MTGQEIKIMTTSTSCASQCPSPHPWGGPTASRTQVLRGGGVSTTLMISLMMVFSLSCDALHMNWLFPIPFHLFQEGKAMALVLGLLPLHLSHIPFPIIDSLQIGAHCIQMGQLVGQDQVIIKIIFAICVHRSSDNLLPLLALLLVPSS
jgi:hypothetical protein